MQRLVASLFSSSSSSGSPTSSSLPLLPWSRPPPRSTRTHAPRRPLSLPLFLPVFLLLLFFLAFPSSRSRPRPRLDPQWEREWRYRNGSNVDVVERLWIHEPDAGGGGKASFIALGASLVDFFVPDRHGTLRDVSLGYENTTLYASDPHYPYFGAIVGRYANRVANASFNLPDGTTVHLPPNEHNGRNTLHGGRWGYSRAGWRVVEHLGSSITFELRDEEGTEGFPATLLTTVTYTLLSSPLRLTTSMSARVLPSPSSSSSSASSSSPSPKPVTPILLSSHLYFNLDGYFPYAPGGGGGGEGGGGRDATASLDGHKLWVDADRFVETDGELIPTGALPPISLDSALDFRTSSSSSSSSDSVGASVGEKLSRGGEVEGLCGTGCSGLDNALVFAPSSSSSSGRYRNDTSTPLLILRSEGSGIRMALRTNQPAVHLYTCNGFSPSPSSPSGAGQYHRKASHRFSADVSDDADVDYYPHQSCLALEPEGLIDAVHHREAWGVDPFYGPGRAYEWWSEYEFTLT
ncbi:hypothetical protein JCM6882_007877 [Rhodosporidiobolus microsporus]